MKKLLKLTLIISIALGFMFSAIEAEAGYQNEYLVKYSEGQYMLTSYAEGSESIHLSAASVGELLNSELLSDGAKLVFLDIELDGIEIKNKNLTLSGSLLINSRDFVIEDSEVGFSSLNLSFSADNGVRLKSGNLTITDSEIISVGKSTVTLDYSSAAELTVKGGTLKSEGAFPAVNLQCGVARISGGNIESPVSKIFSKASLYLSGAPTFSGGSYDVESENPIYLNDGGNSFSGAIKLKYNKEFEKGTLTPVLYKSSQLAQSGITVFEPSGKMLELKYFESSPYTDEKNFSAVYLPYEVSFYSGSELIYTEYILSGEFVKNLPLANIAGYKHLGWYRGNEAFETAEPIYSDLVLNAKYELLPPAFSISSLSFVYDGTAHSLCFEYIYHELLNEGEISYQWYKNGACISVAESLKLVGVSDSGEYICKLKFTHNGNESYAETSPVTVDIKKAEAPLPTLLPKEYNGKPQYPELDLSEYYYFSQNSYTDAGKYPITLTLYDSENYCFRGFDTPSVDLCFEITKAPNRWITEPTVPDIYEGGTLTCEAIAAFGNAEFLFSNDFSGEFSREVPTAAGIYYFIAKVEENNNYSSLESYPRAFSINADRVKAISVTNLPTKLSYTAFELFDTAGMKLAVSYESGKFLEIDGSEAYVLYQNGTSLLFGDSFVKIAYGGIEASLSVNVSRASYELSGVVFESKKYTYDAKPKTLEFLSELPVGKDGIPLGFKISGGGTDVGVYTVTLSFVSDSTNYELPQPITATLEITPLTRSVEWGNSHFVYDTSPKLPEAYITDALGNRVQLSVLGAKSYAGKYSATAVNNDSNYNLTNAEIDFEIQKADYDLSGVFWTSSEFVYDGTEKKVELSGLPNGVFAIGYTDNRATEAGRYLAKVKLSYDTQNYNEPIIEPFSWTLRRRDYDISGFVFASSEYTYDGEIHYPKLVGEMPVGIDGSRPEYSFSGGASEVREGRVRVTVSFHTNSKNYDPPEPVVVYVSIVPRGIEVSWGARVFIYNGEALAPVAYSPFTAVHVLGAKSDAGEYFATAVSENSNYKIINETLAFSIKRKENSWLVPIEIANVYEGNAPAPLAQALEGAVTYRFFTDAEMKNEISAPLESGDYYVIAVSDGGVNYTPIVSEAKKFTVIEEIPVSVSAALLSGQLFSFGKISESDIAVSVEYNSGRKAILPFGEFTVSYQNADSMRVNDSEILISALGFSVLVPVSVKKAELDLSGAYWEEGNFVYDGAEKSINLVGLPMGVSVAFYEGNGVKNSGSYSVKAILSYDAENYNTPKVPSGVINIEKKKVASPKILPLVYSGKDMEIIVENADFYKYSKNLYRDSAKYSVVFELADSENYVFLETLSNTVTVEFCVLPCELNIKIADMQLYRFEEAKVPYYTVEGLPEGLALPELKFTVKNSAISCETSDINFTLNVSEGRVIRLAKLSPGATKTVFFSVLFVVFLLLLILAVVLKRDKFRRIAAGVRLRNKNVIEPYLLPPAPSPKSFAVDENVEKTVNSDSVLNAKEDEEEMTNSDSEFSGEEKTPPENAASALPEKEESVDEAIGGISEEDSANGFEASFVEESQDISAKALDDTRADALISDKMAKTLLRKEGSIITFGTKRKIINLGALNTAFSDGDTVDINRMKAKSLIPYDTGYIKVLADGILDKELRIYANDFSLSAVKMIALLGGEAVKVSTVRVKMPVNPDE